MLAQAPFAGLHFCLPPIFCYHFDVIWCFIMLQLCRRLENELPGGRTHFVETCGLPICTYFSALKLYWLMENVDAVKDAVRTGDASFGTIDTWLIWNLTGGINGGLHITDCSNASRMMLMNLKTLDWDKPTLDALGIPAEVLP
jgi:glycerol kinase